MVTRRFAKAVLKQALRFHSAVLADDVRTVRRVAQLARKRREYHGRGKGWVYAQLQAWADNSVRIMDAGNRPDLSGYLETLWRENPEVALESWLATGATMEEAETMLYLNDGLGNWPANRKSIR